MSELNIIALKILEKGKGILAADESTGTMTKRLDGVNVPSTPENRLLFRETLFSASSMTECIGGVILYDETIKQDSSKKNKIPELISKISSFGLGDYSLNQAGVAAAIASYNDEKFLRYSKLGITVEYTFSLK